MSGPILAATFKRGGAGQGLLKLPVVSLVLTYQVERSYFCHLFLPHTPSDLDTTRGMIHIIL